MKVLVTIMLAIYAIGFLYCGSAFFTMWLRDNPTKHKYEAILAFFLCLIGAILWPLLIIIVLGCASV